MDLTFVTTEDLMKEVSGRFDAFIMAGLRKQKVKECNFYMEGQGDIATCMGLVEIVRQKMDIDGAKLIEFYQGNIEGREE